MIIAPTIIGGLQLAITAPDLIFGSMAFDNRGKELFCSLMTFLVSPFHTTILHLQEYYIELQLRANPDDIKLTSKRDRLRNHTYQFIKIELGLETAGQLTGQLILLFLTNSDTQTIGNVQKLNVNKTLLVLSLMASFIGCFFSYLKGLSTKREYFPVLSKVVAVCFVAPALLTRVLCIIMYFTPALGLFDVLQHWKNEQIPWNIDLLNEMVDPIYDTISLGNGTTNVAWTKINRWTRSLDGTLMSPEYTLYTTFKLKHYFRFFWIILAFNFAFIYLVKNIWSKSFQKMNLVEKLIHVLENIFIPYNTEEWDSAKGNSNDHEQRMKENSSEMSALMKTNFFVNCILMAPMFILGKILW